MTATVRPAAVAGSFYEADPDALRASVRVHLASAPAHDGPAPKAVIAPHAGHVYSGPVAAHAYNALAPRAAVVERVVLIGPAHRVAVEGVAVPSVDAFETPLGIVPIDADARTQLLSLPRVQVDDRPHALEHSLEVHLPFLQEVFGSFRLVPLLAGWASAGEVAAVLEAVWGGDETAVVVSTDLSHYHDIDTARRLDARTAASVVARRPDDIAAEDACGAVPVRGVLDLAARRGLSCRLLDLRTSGDTAGPTDRVVGYGSFALG